MMSEADKLFEGLGYIKDIDISYGMIRYNKDNSCFIRFMIEDKEIEANKIAANGAVWILSISMDLLKVINLKCKELGWIEE